MVLYVCEICGELIQEEICDTCYTASGFDPEEEILLDVYELMEGGCHE